MEASPKVEDTTTSSQGQYACLPNLIQMTSLFAPAISRNTINTSTAGTTSSSTSGASSTISSSSISHAFDCGFGEAQKIADLGDYVSKDSDIYRTSASPIVATVQVDKCGRMCY